LMAALPGAVWEVRAPLIAGAACYAALLAVTWWIRRSTGPPAALDQSRRTGLEWTVMLALVAGGLWFAVLTPQEPHASVSVLDIGHGSAVLIRDGTTQVLVDTGPPDGAVLAALQRVGAHRGLDAVILSHADTDHAGGLYPLLQRMDVRAVYATAPALEDIDFAVGAPLTIGDRIRVSDRVAIDVLAPPEHTADHRQT